LLVEKFLDFNKQHQLFSTKRRVLVAVSGGVDSMVLCSLLQQAGYSFAMAHCNFGLRGEESNGDEQFVSDYATQNEIEFYIERFDTATFAAESKLSVQEAARQLRYAWFNKICREKKFDFIATAHHLNDNIETILFNLSRGTGIKGLRGILPKHDNIIRPLLFATRAEIEAFAMQEKLQWREDSSNASDKYSRNFIRHQIIPLFKELNPSFEETFAENIAVFSEVEKQFNTHFAKVAKTLLFHRHGDVYIAIEKLKQLQDRRSILFTYLSGFGFNAQQVDSMLAQLHGQAGAVYESGQARIIRDRKFLILTKGKTEAASQHYVYSDSCEVKSADFTLKVAPVHAVPASLKTAANSIWVNAQMCTFPLTLRKWKAGDYFYPFGFNLKKKKVKKFLTDIKLPLHKKEDVWVLESNKKIVWVVGFRADERFKVMPNSPVISITVLPHESTAD